MFRLLLFSAGLGQVTPQLFRTPRLKNPLHVRKLSNLSVLSTPTSIVSPPSGHACLHKCRSDMKCQNYPCWFGSTMFCNDALMLLNMSSLPLTVSSISVRSHFLPQWLECDHIGCGDHRLFTILLLLELLLLLPRTLKGLSNVSTRGVAERRSATMSNASLFCGNLEPTRMRWCIWDKGCREVCGVRW